MIDPRFYPAPHPEPLPQLLAQCKQLFAAFAVSVPHNDVVIHNAASLRDATAGDITFFDNPKFAHDLQQTNAAACVIHASNIHLVPEHCVALVTPQPYRDFAYVLQTLYPQKTAPVTRRTDCPPQVLIDDTAVVAHSALISEGTVIGAHVFIGDGVCIGRDCVIEAGCTITHSLIGDRVRLMPGVRLGQDGFGYAPTAQGHVKVPQLGRAIVQDDVDIGANTTIDRGALSDTIIGEGSKLDNLIQIGHNVQIGRLCLMAGLTAIAGSTHIADGVFIGGQSAIAGHLTIGQGARIAGGSAVMHNVPAGETWGGIPARPLKQVFREHAFIQKLMKK